MENERMGDVQYKAENGVVTGVRGKWQWQAKKGEERENCGGKV